MFSAGGYKPPVFFWPYNRVTMKKVVHAACPHDCPDACGVLTRGFRDWLEREGHVRLDFEPQLSDSGSQFSD
jgi:hypothetical protein